MFLLQIHCYENCMRKYILNYQRDIEKDAAKKTAGSEGLRESFMFLATLQFETKYALHTYNEFNKKYLSSDIHISNRRIKSLLITLVTVFILLIQRTPLFHK